MIKIKNKKESVKCYKCHKVIKETPIEDIGGRDTRIIYFHSGKCYEDFLNSKKETEEFEYLCNYIKDIYHEENLEMPAGFCSALYDIRNGAVRYVKNGTNNSNSMKKDGTPFDVLLESYQIAENKIKEITDKKVFTNRTAKYKYGLAIAKSKIEAVYARRKLAEQREAKRNMEIMNNDDIQKKLEQEVIVKYKDRLKTEKPKGDISHLFD